MTEQYNRTNWVNGETALNANNMNHIEFGILNNSVDISSLKGDMKFIDVIDTLPTQNVAVGNVYQAAVAGLYGTNKIGDLLVCIGIDPEISWHIIPSGDETAGTVTEVSAGPGLVGGTITGSGSLSLDASYTANANRNGLLSAENFRKLRDIDAQNSDLRDYTKLNNIPLQLQELQIKQESGKGEGSQNYVMSQQATTTALETKSDIGHQHELTDISNGSGTEAGRLDNLLNGKAPLDHTHGVINANGRLIDNTGIRTNCFLKSNDTDGTLVPIPKINSSDINGTTIGNVNLTELKTALYDETTQQVMTKAAKEDHVHEVFNGSSNGFAPQAPADNPENFLLSGNGTWVQAIVTTASTAIINLIYPIGSYFETSNPDFNPNTAEGWTGTWVLENEGLFHVSAGTADTSAYKCGPTTGANKSTETVPAGKGIADGGAKEVKLTGAQSGQKGGTFTTSTTGNHSHSFSSIQRDTSKKTLDSGDKGYPTATKATAAAGNHYHSVTLTASDATTAHENRPPFVCIFRWHRVADPPAPAENTTPTTT